MNILSNFSERLKEQLDERNITPETLSSAVEISYSNIYKWLRNEAIPSLASLIKIGDYLCCTLDFLSGRAVENYFTKPKIATAFCERLRLILTNKNISAYQFAKEANIPRNSLHNWLTGRSEPLLDSLITLANYQDCTIDFLLGR